MLAVFNGYVYRLIVSSCIFIRFFLKKHICKTQYSNIILFARSGKCISVMRLVFVCVGFVALLPSFITLFGGTGK